MEIGIKIKGLAEMDQALTAFPTRVQRAMLGKSLRAAAKVVQAAARANVPVETGTLRRALAVRSLKRNGTASKMGVGIRSIKRSFANSSANRRQGRAGKVYLVPAAYYGRYLEFGAKRHPIVARGKVLAGNGRIFGKKVNHPGVTPRPFLKPALERNTTQVLQTFGDTLNRLIQQSYGGR